MCRRAKHRIIPIHIRLQVLADYNQLVEMGAETKYSILGLQKLWKVKLGTRHYPFSRRTFFRWARDLNVDLLSSKVTLDDTR
ncbi:MAG: hypothetical protein NTY77_05560 [Elusimicrobia bacterium]|nr:hypothetical protein [Elusimicrobiota bacterium]